MQQGGESKRAIFNVLKGIGILEVVIHHCLSHSARKFTNEFSVEWWVLRIANRILHFAIPLFLLVSAALLTQSLVKRRDWGRFVQRRASRTLWPYLLWSGIYIVFRLLFLKVGSDTEMISATYPLLGELQGPRLLVDIPMLTHDLLWGKAYFHLYFMVVLLQLAMLLPFAILLIERIGSSFLHVLLGALGLQLGVYILQASLLRVEAPASMAIWYLPSLSIGVWFGLFGDRWAPVWKSLRKAIPLIGCASLGWYLWESIDVTLDRPVSSIGLNLALTLYALTVSLWLYSIAPLIASRRSGEILSKLGEVSLPMFLIHPIVLFFLSGPRINALLEKLPLSSIWLTLLVLGLSYSASKFLSRTRIDRILFGQSLKAVTSS